MDDFKDLYDQAIETGLDNLAILQLAAAWCQNVAVTKGPMGTGEVELLTGLPISGGSLRCDYAMAPTIFGMRLEASAVSFYEENCIGCPHRKPTGATDHLGTWADAVVAEREEERQRHERARQDAAGARRRRREHRRLLLGAPDPTVQSILDLIDRIDAEERDKEAERLLLSHAEMSPGDFPDALVAHMTSEAIAIGNDALLESVIAVFERQGRPATDRILEVAFEAVGRRVAPHAAGRVIAVHAERFDVDDRALHGIVRLAAGDPTGLSHHRVGAEPAALLRLYDEDQARAISWLANSLHDREVWTRATAAHAAEKLVAARPEAAAALLPALLDAIQLPDKSRYGGDPFATGEAQNVVADILVADPGGTSRRIDTRMRKADTTHARKLWRCYDSASRSRLAEPLSKSAADTIVRRAVALLNGDLDPELGHEVADTLELVCHYHGDELDLSLVDVVKLVLRWADRLQAYEASRLADDASVSPQDVLLASLNWDSGRITIASVHSKLERVLEARATREPGRYIGILTGKSWRRAEASRIGRVSLLDALGSAARDQELLKRVRPVLIAALDGDRVGERAAALRAIAEIGQHDVPIGDELGQRVVAGLAHEKEIVVLGAVRALSSIEVTVNAKPEVIVFLINFALAYGPGRVRSYDVERAVYLVLRLSKGEPYEDVAVQRMLEVIAALPSAESAELLYRLPVQSHPAWPAAAVHALHVDPDPNYYGIHDRKREELLRQLAALATEQLSPFFDELGKIAEERVPHDRSWAWAVADVLARHHQHQRAATVCDSVVAALPNTPEQGPARRYARQVSLGHHLDAAASTGDEDAGERALKEWAHLAAERGDD